MDVYSSIFGELTKEVQIRIDAATELRKRLFDQNIYERYLDWDVPTIGLNFEELIGQYNLSVAAATLDSKGKEPILGTEGLETLKQKVLTHQMSYSMPIEEYRKVLQILDSRMLTDDQKTQQLINLMWNNVSTVVKSVQSKLDIISWVPCPTRGYLPLMPIITLKEGYVVLLITRCRPRISLALPLTGRRPIRTTSILSRISKVSWMRPKTR